MANLDALDKYIAGRLAKISSLAPDFPELYQRIDDALRLQREALAPVSDEQPDDQFEGEF